MNEIHTIFGAGQIGLLLARSLAEGGFGVRLVRRGAPGAEIQGVTWMRGDATDRVFAEKACRGATAVYNCTNPPDYHRWEGVLEPLFRSIRDAAGRAGARLVQLDNLYMYGRPEQTPFDERTPMRPCGTKGELRKRLFDELWEAHARGDVVATCGHASDFFGPVTPNSAVFRPDTYERILAGSSVYVFGNPDMVHGYTYAPDVARGLAVLGTHEAALGRAWHLPTSARLSTRELLERFAERAGTRIKVRRVPNWALKTLGVVSPLVSALAEMTYQWEVPYLLDDGDFCRTFAVGPTPLDDAIDATLAAHRSVEAAA